MSYIRATSNPEALYIFGGPGHMVDISVGPEIDFRVPYDDFKGIAKLFWEEFDLFDDPVTFGTITLSTDSGPEPVPETLAEVIASGPRDHLVKFTYTPPNGEEKSFSMWYVTAFYLFKRFQPMEHIHWRDLSLWDRIKWVLFG